MADDAEELRLNTLHRFEKHSPRLVLQEYSHCEVPAGCGGVVLRWFDPTEGAPATVRVHVLGARVSVWLDGQVLASSRTTLRSGAHALAVELVRERRGPFPLAIYVGLDEPDADADAGAPEPANRLAAPRTAWRLAAAPPPPTWIERRFDDAAWLRPVPLTAALLARLARHERVAFERPPAFQLDADRAWLRVAFEVPA